jgi:hypothetical protein
MNGTRNLEKQNLKSFVPFNALYHARRNQKDRHIRQNL